MSMARGILKWLAILFTLVALSACSKFMKTKTANIGFFADQTIAMLGEAELGFSRDDAIYTRDFFDFEGEEEQRVLLYRKEADKFFDVIVAYSLKLVIIWETNKKEADKVAAYADYLATFDDTVLEKLELERDHYDNLIEKVKGQDKFLDALKEAQPVINAAGRHMMLVLDEIVESAQDLTLKMDMKIDVRYADVIRYQAALEKEKYAVLGSMEHLYKIHKGDAEAFKKLLESGVVRSEKLIPKGSPTREDLNAIGQHLMKRLEALHLIGEEIKPDWETYRATHRELDKLEVSVMSQVNQARMLTLVWLRAHQKMASGITNPAEWFDITASTTNLLRRGIVPLP